MSSTIQLSIQNKLATITLDRGRSNPMNQQMVTELLECIQNLESDDDVGGVVITGKEGFFTSGVDLIEAYSYDEVQTRKFWTEFLALQASLAAFRKPIVAAISGHSPAGGCVLAICCDYRLMVEGDFIIGLNEIPVGIIVPDFVFALYAFWLGERKAYQSLLEGKFFKVDEALSIGLIDESCIAEELLTAAEKKARAYMKFNPVTWSESKINLRKQLLAQINADHSDVLESMLKQWWAPATRQGLEMMIQNLKSKK